MTFRSDWLQNLREIPESKVHLPNVQFVHVTHIDDNRICDDILLKNVPFIPDFYCNLLSVSKLTMDLKCHANFYPKFMIFQLSNGRVLKVARESIGLYTCFPSPRAYKTMSIYDHAMNSCNDLWHQHLGHV